jgi:hypothetical protein
MAKKSKFSTFWAIKESWSFYKKQPALNAVILWLFIVPSYLGDIATRVLDPFDPLRVPSLQTFFALYDPYKVSLLLFFLILFFFTLWGTASVLLVGKKLVHSRAGRSRTSFHSVAGDALPFVPPLIITSVLRTCITIYWSLLFIIPATFILLRDSCQKLVYDTAMYLSGATPVAPSDADFLASLKHCPELFLLLPLLIPALWYSFRTFLYAVITVADSIAYRQALKRSKELVRGRVFFILKILVGLCVLIFVPAQILGGLFQILFQELAPAYTLVADLLTETFFGMSTVLFLLSLTLLYGHLKERPVEVKP